MTAAPTTGPVLAIIGPTDTGGSYVSTVPTVSLSGILRDDTSTVTNLGWATDNGKSGTISVGPQWNTGPIPLVGGANKITVTATDAAGKSASAFINVTYTAPVAPFRIDSVSPDRLPALPPGQTKDLTITGSGFTLSTRLRLVAPFSTQPLDVTPQYVSPQELRYTFAYGEVRGTYSVTAYDGAKTSAAVTFYVPPILTAGDLPAPTISPDGGSYSGPIKVSLTSATPGTAIRFTLDGSDPTVDSPGYLQPFTLSASATVKARTFKDGYAPSPVNSAIFSISVVPTYFPAPTPLAPSNGSTNVSQLPTFSWTPVSGVDYYRIITATNPADLPSGPNDETGGPSVGYVATVIAPSTQFVPSSNFKGQQTIYWRVHGRTSSKGGIWSPVFSFTTGGTAEPGPPVIGSLTSSPAAVAQAQPFTLTANDVTDPNSTASISNVGFMFDSNGNGKYDSGPDYFVGVDTDGTDGWSVPLNSIDFPPGAAHFLAQAVNSTTHKISGLASTTVNIAAAPAVTGLAISGPSRVEQSGPQGYSAVATFANGTSASVTGLATWSASAPSGTVVSAGKGDFIFTSINGDETATLRASFGGVDAQYAVALVDTSRSRISVSDASVTEGNGGTTTAVFTVSLSTAAAGPVSVDYATADGTAKAGSDYTATRGTLTFDPGQTSKTISVPILGDSVVEADETFTVNLSNPVNALFDRAAGVGTILNDDRPPAPRLTYDVDGSGSIGNGDYSFLSAAWHTRPGDAKWDARVDFDGSGYISSGDYSWFSANWHKRADDPSVTYPPLPKAAAASVAVRAVPLVATPAAVPTPAVRPQAMTVRPIWAASELIDFADSDARKGKPRVALATTRRAAAFLA